LPAESAPGESANTAQTSKAQLIVELQSTKRSGALPHSSESSGPESRGVFALQSLPHAMTSSLKQKPGHLSANESAPQAQSAGQAPLGQESNPFSSPHPSLVPSAKSGAHDSIADPASISTVDDDGQSRLTAKSAVSADGGLSTLLESGSGGPSTSPSKQPHQPPTKTTHVPALSNGLAPSLPAEKFTAGLPHVSPARSRDARSDPVPKSSPLPPRSAGLSPTKHSPPVPRTQHWPNGGSSNGVATPLVAGAHPPVAVLPAVAREQILTPPIKSAESAKAPPAQQQAQGLQTPKLVPSSSPRLDAPSPT
jgi:hypothetical protein